MTGPRRALRNLRRGRAQQMLAAATAASALPLGVEVYVNHFGGSFANRWMWSPVALLPALSVSAAAAVRSPRAARTALPATAALVCANGAFGTFMHGRGIARKPGGWSEPTYNLVQGPPLLAPGSLTMVGGLGLLAALMRRERW
ncbi:MAG TPA: hypothetical protein VFG42_01490 [Baekduia sp.]|jgi:hypothetical protein|uniref:hypothetical protein n=1 Tax=Baekduia sp. TaxID=2600305 RepID=UPI002D798960|nr:hypothetical protein [Baekduia sp.]HET6505436.1 hypothetical protein [Baekduia sp.]